MRDICEHFDVLILGAGVTGLASAYFLARSGQRVCLLDDYPSPGGNHISRELNGFTFDVGSIFFFPDNPQFKMFPGSNENFVPVDLTMSRITPQGQVRPYPLSIQDEILKHPGVLLRVALSLGFSLLIKPWYQRGKSRDLPYRQLSLPPIRIAELSSAFLRDRFEAN